MLFRISQCLSFAGRYAEARPYLARLRSEFPKSPFLADGDKLEQTFPASAPVAPPAAAAPPADKPPATPPSNH